MAQRRLKRKTYDNASTSHVASLLFVYNSNTKSMIFKRYSRRFVLTAPCLQPSIQVGCLFCIFLEPYVILPLIHSALVLFCLLITHEAGILRHCFIPLLSNNNVVLNKNLSSEDHLYLYILLKKYNFEVFKSHFYLMTK